MNVTVDDGRIVPGGGDAICASSPGVRVAVGGSVFVGVALGPAVGVLVGVRVGVLVTEAPGLTTTLAHQVPHLLEFGPVPTRVLLYSWIVHMALSSDGSTTVLL